MTRRVSRPRPDEGPQSTASWRARAYSVIFLTDTPAGRAFDVALLVVILASVVAVVLESVEAIAAEHGAVLRGLEWGFTVLFTVEYLLRLVCVGRPLRYAASPFGIIDLLAILPTYLSLLLPGSQSLLVIRILRLLRVFRVLKLIRLLDEADLLLAALRASRTKIAVFLWGVFTVLVVVGTAMHLIEGPAHGFTSIPRGIYWAVVTLTTVGYGDITPQTVPGQFLASLVMILGYGIIAVPTGIVTSELTFARGRWRSRSRPLCATCGATDHGEDARYCRICGTVLSGATAAAGPPPGHGADRPAPEPGQHGG